MLLGQLLMMIRSENLHFKIMFERYFYALANCCCLIGIECLHFIIQYLIRATFSGQLIKPASYLLVNNLLAGRRDF